MKAEAAANDVSFGRIWALAWPGIVANTLISSVGLAYIKIVADGGAASVAAVSSGHRVFVLLQALVMGLSVATTALVATHWGAGDRKAASEWTWQSLYLGIAFALVVMFFGWLFADHLAWAFGLEGDAAIELALFLRVLLLFNIFHAIGAVLSSAFRAAGDARTPMRFIFFSTAMSLVLSIVFGRGVFGLPDLGVAGVALGSGLAPLIAFSLFTRRWRRNRYLLSAGPRPSLDVAAWRELLRIGMPATIEQAIVHGSLLVFMRYTAFYGTAAFAAFGVTYSILAVVIVVGFGFSMAGSAVAGQALGAGDLPAVRRAAGRIFVLSGFGMAIPGIACFVYAEPLAYLLVPDPEVARVAAPFMQILAAVLPLLALESAFSGVLRGIGDTRFTLFSTISGLSCRLGLGAIVVINEWSANLLFGTLFVDYLVKSTLVSVRLWRKTSEPEPRNA